MERAERHRLSIAPMMDRTDRHFRVFLRGLTRGALLYTEMIPTGAVLFGDRDKALGFDPRENPLSLQLGGDDPEALARCAALAEEHGYDEVNLNVGCPSSRVQEGNFGVCLMARPERVAEAVVAMAGACSLPVTVKHRIGFDDLDRYEDMKRFVETVAETGRCARFTVHARKAWLSGLDPKQNRTIPPLRYAEVHRLKTELPELSVEINGGFLTLDQVEEQLEHVDAVMIGRAAYDDPYLLAEADRRIYQEDTPVPSRRDAVESYLPYVREQLERGVYLSHLTRHILGLFKGCPGARAWRRHISENAHKPGAGVEVIEGALAQVPEDVQTETPTPVPATAPPLLVTPAT